MSTSERCMGKMWLLSVLLLVLSSSQSWATLTGPAILQAALDERTNQDLKEPCDRDRFYPSYDFVIVGAGTAGAVLANRLTENPKVTVLLIEAGQPEPTLAEVPAFASYMIGTDIDWGFTSEPDVNYCRGMKDGRCPLPRGRVMGGTSSINYAINTRGNRRDYDNWATMGNRGWEYKSVLPYFKKLENMAIADYRNNRTYHGYSGPMKVDRPFRYPFSNIFIQAGRELGWPANHDHNGARQVGFPQPQHFMKDGARLSSSRGYLHPIRNRKNLHVTKYSLVTKINFGPLNRAKGVTFEKYGSDYKVNATKEVLLCAGAIQSPKLLMLSGIGPRGHLAELGICPVRMDLPVGENLQDHAGPTGLIYETNVTVPNQDSETLVDLWRSWRQGPLAGFGMDLAPLDTKSPGKPNGWADVEIMSVYSESSPGQLNAMVEYNAETMNDLFPRSCGSDNVFLLQMVPFVMRPKSKGRVLLRDTDPRSPPKIYPNYWSHPDDIRAAVRGVRQIQALGGTDAFKSVNARLRTNRPRHCANLRFLSDEYIECLCRETTMSMSQFTGTCSMGKVVDPNLKVKGVMGLRVVDQSVMPRIPSAHMSAPTYMLAERAADLIKSEWCRL